MLKRQRNTKILVKYYVDSVHYEIRTHVDLLTDLGCLTFRLPASSQCISGHVVTNLAPQNRFRVHSKGYERLHTQNIQAIGHWSLPRYLRLHQRYGKLLSALEQCN
jgi:hypothetical protein